MTFHAIGYRIVACMIRYVVQISFASSYHQSIKVGEAFKEFLQHYFVNLYGLWTFKRNFSFLITYFIVVKFNKLLWQHDDVCKIIHFNACRMSCFNVLAHPICRLHYPLSFFGTLWKDLWI